MNNLRKILNNNNLKIKSLKYQGKVVILETDKRMLIIIEFMSILKIEVLSTFLKVIILKILIMK